MSYNKSSSHQSNKSTGGTYADFMATKGPSSPPSPTVFTHKRPTESPSVLIDNMNKLKLDGPLPPSTTIETPEFPHSTPTVKLPTMKSEPASETWADMMENSPIASASLPSSPTTSTSSTTSSVTSSTKPQPKALDSIHAPSSSSTSSPSTPAWRKPRTKTQHMKSVLYAPAEKNVKGKYGHWSNLKGDPEKLVRLNDPDAKPLESRWAC